MGDIQNHKLWKFPSTQNIEEGSVQDVADNEENKVDSEYEDEQEDPKIVNVY